MYKWMYDRMVEEYSKESKEELIQRIMTFEELECKDRSFINQCQSGSTVYSINHLFETIETLKKCLADPDRTVENLQECFLGLWLSADSANIGWNYIKNGISQINDDSRVEKELEKFKRRVSKAKDSDDII